MVVIAQGKLTVGYVAADVFETSVGYGTYRHEVMQLVGRQCELDFTLFIGRVLPEQCLSLHVFGRFYACKTKYGRSQVCEVDQRIIFAGCLFSRQVLPLGREVGYQGHFQTAFIQIAFAAWNATAVVAEEEDNRVVVQSFFFQVFQEESQPCVHILHGFQVAGIVGTYFGQVRHVGG